MLSTQRTKYCKVQKHKKFKNKTILWTLLYFFYLLSMNKKQDCFNKQGVPRCWFGTMEQILLERHVYTTGSRANRISTHN